MMDNRLIRKRSPRANIRLIIHGPGHGPNDRGLLERLVQGATRSLMYGPSQRWG
jgi:hypothetical protein